MALTRNFKEPAQKRRIERHPPFGDALLCEGIDIMLPGDVATGEEILRDAVKATVGLEKLGEATGRPAKSLIRMLDARGNRQACNLFGIIGYLQKQAEVELQVAAVGAERCWRATLRPLAKKSRAIERIARDTESGLHRAAMRARKDGRRGIFVEPAERRLPAVLILDSVLYQMNGGANGQQRSRWVSRGRRHSESGDRGGSNRRHCRSSWSALGMGSGADWCISSGV